MMVRLHYVSPLNPGVNVRVSTREEWLTYIVKARAEEAAKPDDLFGPLLEAIYSAVETVCTGVASRVAVADPVSHGEWIVEVAQ